MSDDTKKLARVFQAETGCAYTTALRAVQNKLAELLVEGVNLRDARHRVATMQPGELGLRAQEPRP